MNRNLPATLGWREEFTLCSASQPSLNSLTGFTYRGNVGVSFSPHTLRDEVPPQVSLIIGNFYRSRVFKMQERSRTGETAEPNVSQEEAIDEHTQE